MRALAAAVAAAAAVASATAPTPPPPPPPWPFSWDKISTFASPGASARFMNASELARFSNFSMMNIWGLNATCVNTTTGALFAPSCPGSWCDCIGAPAFHRAAGYEAQRWVLNMDESLQAQSAALKAAAGAGRVLPVIGYFNLDVAQQYSRHQFDFCYDNETFAALRLVVESKGRQIDCFVDNCNYQGMEFCMYDFRLPAARDFWVETVLPALIDSPDIDGVFLDECDNLVNNLCAQWGCTPQELADLTNGTLTLIDAALAKAAALGKWLSISLTSTLARNPAYHAAVLDSIGRHGHGFRYYEFFSSESDLEAFIYEAQTLGLPVQAHAESMHMTPDFAELAAFLIAAGPYSYFSFSWGWTLSDFPWLSYFDEPLGAPLGPPVRSNSSVPVPAWAVLNATNVVCGLVPAPGRSGPNVAFLGSLGSADACAAAARANATLSSWTWVGPDGGEWSHGCYARLEPPPPSCLPPNAGGCNAPCYTDSEPAIASAVNYAFLRNSSVWSRDFEHLHVEFEPASYAARITAR